MQAPLTVGAAAAETGWSARMLRYLEEHGLVVPRRTRGRLPASTACRAEPAALAARAPPAVRRRARPSSRSRAGCAASPSCARAVDGWLAAGDDTGSWVEWEQRKHERLLAA